MSLVPGALANCEVGTRNEWITLFIVSLVPGALAILAREE